MKFEFSAGGVVYKKSKGEIEILVSQHSMHHGWVFPKGLIGDTKETETKEETAVREVKEETGMDAKIIAPLKKVEYWYEWEGEKRKKTVYYFIMQHLGGKMTERDDEMEAVEWLPIDKIEARLTYPSDREVWKEARPVIENLMHDIKN